VIVAAIAGGLLALFRGRDSIVRWAGAVALLGLVAYVFTPLSAAGAEGEPVGFGINIRYAIPPLLLGLTLLPLVPRRLQGWREWTLIGALLAVLVITNRSDAVLRDPSRVFALTFALLLVAVPAGLIWLSRRKTLVPGGGGSPAATGPAGPRRLSLVLSGFIALALLVLAIGYPLQRNYLSDRFGPESEIPGLHLDSAYRWARDKSDARIGIVGTTAGFLQYGLFGTDLSNRVLYLGEKGPHGAFNAIPTCRAFRAAVSAADLDYLVTAPFLNFLHTDNPVPSPEVVWLRGVPAAIAFDHDGPVTIWRLGDEIDASACDSLNAPLHRIPGTPRSQSR
jgi:hypothetical protein